ncbi:DUF2726 domain-containing protein [Marinobacterium lutimaris]|uniref:DUF2726 domain-containing protein n=1 Tax=Marinobacterium lutimaris TaxID=568106 RepID=A0A1H6CA07_9GAMM|nr:DUF2726 domain-containing protein [Marinobacterium lutimaris]SEG69748.1 Protein of unknown function [Marinobacterium lutimaris]
MEWMILFVILLFVLAIAAKKLNAGAGAVKESGTDHRYRSRKTLFTAAERSFLGVLDSVIDPSQHRIFGKVRVADLIEPEPNRNRGQWKSAFNRINAKHFDFVICNADDLTPVAAIELDDASHKQNKRQQRDEFLEKVCGQVGLPLVRVPAKRGYQLEEVKAALAGVSVKVEKVGAGEKDNLENGGANISGVVG